MKVTRSKENLEKAKRLAKLIAQRKLIEREEKELKEFFLAQLKKCSGLRAGAILLIKESRTRVDYDTKQLIQDKGLKFMAKYKKTSGYSFLDVKVNKSAA